MGMDASPEGSPTSGRRRIDLAWVLVMGGIAVTFFSLFAPVYLELGYEMYFLVAGVLLMVAGFVVGSRPR